MTENQFQTKVIKYLRGKGHYVLNVAGSSQQRKGTPDLIVCINGTFWGIELKCKGNKPSPLQLHALKEIDNAGGIAIVLYEDQFDSFKKKLEDMVSHGEVN